MKSSDGGSVTIWVLGLSLLLLLFGGLALDFWRGLAMQRELAAAADSAAIAAASGLDVDEYYATGRLVLDPARSRTLASASLALQDLGDVTHRVEVAPDGSEVKVIVQGALDLGLLGVFVDQSEPLTVGASATSYPRLVP